MPDKKQNDNQNSFVKKVWIASLIIAMIAVVLLVFKATFVILIQILAGALIAFYFRGISSFIRRKFDWNSKLTMSISTIGTVLIIGLICYFIGARVSSDTMELKKSMPEMVSKVESQLQHSDFGKEIISRAKDIKSSDEFSSFISTFFSTTLGGLAQIYVVILIGVFFTAAPQLYIKGIILLVPPKNKDKAKDVMNDLGVSLKNWLLGKFIAMFGVFILTAIGLAIIGVPMWLTLAIIAGLLNFVPNFGPIASAVPAILVGLTIGLTTTLIILGLYIVVQLFETSFITPRAQRKLTKIPPALIMISQVLMASLAGVWGVIFATPFVLIIMVVVEDLYTKPMNEKSTNSNQIEEANADN